MTYGKMEMYQQALWRGVSPTLRLNNLGERSDIQCSEGGVGSRFGLRSDDTASRRTLQHVGLSESCNWTNERS
jgi:hypothetical protein